MSHAEERLANDPTSELWGEHRARYRFASQFVNGNRVLDIACGAGFGLEMLEEANAWAVGVDYDREALGDVRRRLPTTRLARADGMRLPFNGGSFETVVSFETLEHVTDARALVFELRRVLRPGGYLVLSTPNRSFGPQDHHTANKFHIREFTANELYDCLNECFAEVRLYGQRPSSTYKYVPFLMHESRYVVPELMWKTLTRLPFILKNRLALSISGRPFYPGESDYGFEPDATNGSHVLVAVAR